MDAISWSSKRQPTVALSSCEAEYIYGDNQGAIALAQFHARDIQHHFVRENQDKGLVDILTDNQIADGLTKALPKDAFHRFRKSLGLETRLTFEILQRQHLSGTAGDTAMDQPDLEITICTRCLGKVYTIGKEHFSMP